MSADRPYFKYLGEMRFLWLKFVNSSKEIDTNKAIKNKIY
jgi:hypothetical protein